MDVKGTTYVVLPGDTLAGVALKHKLKVNELKRMNRGIGNLLFTGQVYHRYIISFAFLGYGLTVQLYFLHLFSPFKKVLSIYHIFNFVRC